MSLLLVPAVMSWSEIRTDVSEHWYIYASMPFIAAAIGYVTKIVAIEMLYRPLKFVGIGPIGWQGLVPRRAGKVAAVTIELLTENLLKVEDLLDKLVYVATNPVKDGLVEKVRHWPGPAFVAALLYGKTMRAHRPRHFFSDDGPMPEAIELTLGLPDHIANKQALLETLQRRIGEV